jgi:anti-sigma B factor antagonist
MDITTDRAGTIAIVMLSGALTATTAESLTDKAQALCDDPITGLLIDFTDVPRLASAGIRSLLQIRRRCEERGITVALCGTNDLIEELFGIAGLIGLFTLHPDRKAGLDALNKA